MEEVKRVEKLRSGVREMVGSRAADCSAGGGVAREPRLFTAAGRTELGGNHTDHNRGKVLAASIQLDALAAVVPREDKRVVFRSTGFPDVDVDLSSLDARDDEKGTTESLVRGIAAQFAADGAAIKGWTACADSTVLPGSGLSSSAAVEVLFGTIFNYLYAGGRYAPLSIAKMSQKAENDWFGKPCGLMDQAASAIGGAVALDFADDDAPRVTRMEFDPAAAGYALCVVNTGGSHADLTADYAAIPAEMKAIAAFFGKTCLREVNENAFYAKLSEIRAACGDRAVLRAMHFFDENRRVDAMTAALTSMRGVAGQSPAQGVAQGVAKQRPERGGDAPLPSSYYMEDFLDAVEDSGASSMNLLQNTSAPLHAEAQGIPLAIALTKRFECEQNRKETKAKRKRNRMRSTARVHGGGFAGTAQVYVPLEWAAEYAHYMEGIFGAGAVTELRIRPLGTGEINL